MDHSITHHGRAAEAVTSVQMKEIERRADEAGLSYDQMMENAGAGAAEMIDSIFPVSGKKILIICGKGNNGGDGFVAARMFTEKRADVTLILAEGEPKTADAIKNWNICKGLAVPMIQSGSEDAMVIGRLADEADLIVDAIYGTGFHGTLQEQVRQLTRTVNRSNAAVYALDIPSGLNGDTGEADEDTVRADETVAFHRLKPAHLDEKCGIYCGRIVCISIGIEAVLKS